MIICCEDCGSCLHMCCKAKFFVFNGVRFFNKEKVRVTYCENRIFGDEIVFNTFCLDETVEISNDGAFLSSYCDGILFKRPLYDLKFNSLICKIEKIS